ncbi:CheR family methyltransferase [Methylobacterium gossipiicola]|uniref:protein-glutamate O-methyltransferase n=1 Tax=Methylobacterium gossipiicola TaxID=582675 RepID=A0A1I2U177_9HYPH|nr:protein-glutamate O-methyltransferase CheR [Methylobacterium gossipiicola]SFG68636.1 chemotaxis protein methyltransferase CheR [Methylobacterium gossipiicola]
MRRPGPESDPAFPALKARIIARTGHHYYADKDDLLLDRLRKRYRANDLTEAAAYLGLLDDRLAGPAEWAALEAEITIGETFFFRYAEQFAALRGTILPGLVAARAPERSLKIWSAGCSTGAEPYSLAILLHEILGAALPEWRVDILGTDISTAALATARAGLYGRWAMRTLPPEERLRYFVPGPIRPGPGREGTYTLRPEYRRMVRFERRNLMDLVDGSAAPRTDAFDLILCRNVLIYFEAEVVLGIVRGLGRRLRPDGWLLVGHAEPNPDFAQTLDPVNLPGTVAYRPGGLGEIAAVPKPAVTAPWQPALPWIEAEGADPDGAHEAPSPDIAPVVEERAVSRDPTAPSWDEAVTHDTPGDALAEIRALSDSGETAEAWRRVRAALRTAPMEAALHYYEGLLARTLGRDAEAEAALRRTLYLDPGFVMAHHQLGLLLLAVSRPEEGRRFLDNAVRLGQALPAEACLAEADGLGPRELAQSAALIRSAADGAAR